MENEWKSFVGHFFMAFGVISFCSILVLYFAGEPGLGHFGLYGFPLISMVYAFVKMGEAKTKRQNEIISALDEVRAEMKKHGNEEDEESQMNPNDGRPQS